MLALINNQDGILSVVSEGVWLDLPNGDRLSATDGWSNGTYRLAEIQQAEPVPDGKQVASTSVDLVAGEPRYVHVLEDAVPVRLSVLKSTVQQRIIDAGKMADAYAALTANPVYFARWFAPDHPVVYCDDPDAVGLVTALGLDPEIILAAAAL
jgi:hypothetical protein